MNIYDMSIAEIRIIMKQFGKTAYGRTVFFIAYFVPMVMFLSFIGSTIISAITGNLTLGYISVALLLAFIVVFMVANAYYYRELREYVAHFQSSDHARVRRYFNR